MQRVELQYHAGEQRFSMLSTLSKSLEAITTPVSKMSTLIGGYILFFLMSLTTLNIILRYLFVRPLPWAYEVSEFATALLCSLGFPMAAVMKKNVNVTILSDKFPKSVQQILYAVVDLIAFLTSVLISWQAFTQSFLLLQSQETSALLRLPKTYFVMILGLGFGLTSAVLFQDCLDSLSLIVNSEKGKAKLYFLLFAGITFGVLSFPLWGREIFDLRPITVGVIGLLLSLSLIFARVTIGFALGLSGFLGLIYLRGVDPALSVLGTVPYGNITNYNLAVMPLFILMGLFGAKSGMIDDLFDTLYKWFGSLKGGVAIATIGLSAFFGSICGSSAAGTATMCKICLAPMRRYRYADSLATASIAAGGPLSNLIPPSMGFIIYGLMTDTSIGKLFIAGIIPGILNTLLFMLLINIQCQLNPSLGPPAGRAPLKAKLVSLKHTGPVLFFFLLIIGGIYAGIFTPIEAGGMGAFGIMMFIIVKRKFSFSMLNEALIDSVSTTVMVFLIFIGAMILSYFMAAGGIPLALGKAVNVLHIPRMAVIVSIVIIYVILGCLMETLSMMLFTIPVFFPIIRGLGFDPIWYGVMMVLLSDLGMITPPFGMTVFIMSGMTGVPTYTVFRGVLPFVIADFATITILIIWPGIATFLPNLIQ